MMACSVSYAPVFSRGQPRLRFRGRYRGSINSNVPYSIGTDGRFLRLAGFSAWCPLETRARERRARGS